MVEAVKNCYITFEQDSIVGYQCKCPKCGQLAHQLSVNPMPPGTEWPGKSYCPNCQEEFETLIRFV